MRLDVATEIAALRNERARLDAVLAYLESKLSGAPDAPAAPEPIPAPPAQNEAAPVKAKRGGRKRTPAATPLAAVAPETATVLAAVRTPGRRKRRDGKPTIGERIESVLKGGVAMVFGDVLAAVQAVDASIRESSVRTDLIRAVKRGLVQIDAAKRYYLPGTVLQPLPDGTDVTPPSRGRRRAAAEAPPETAPKRRGRKPSTAPKPPKPEKPKATPGRRRRGDGKPTIGERIASVLQDGAALVAGEVISAVQALDAAIQESSIRTDLNRALGRGLLQRDEHKRYHMPGVVPPPPPPKAVESAPEPKKRGRRKAAEPAPPLAGKRRSGRRRPPKPEGAGTLKDSIVARLKDGPLSQGELFNAVRVARPDCLAASIRAEIAGALKKGLISQNDSGLYSA